MEVTHAKVDEVIRNQDRHYVSAMTLALDASEVMIAQLRMCNSELQAMVGFCQTITDINNRRVTILAAEEAARLAALEKPTDA